MDEPSRRPVQPRGGALKPPTRPKPKTAPKPKSVSSFNTRGPADASKLPTGVTEGVNGHQGGQEAGPTTSTPTPKPRPRPIPAKRTSLAKKPTDSPDGDTSKSPRRSPVIVEAASEGLNAKSDLPNEKDENSATASGVTAQVPTIPEAKSPKSDAEQQVTTETKPPTEGVSPPNTTAVPSETLEEPVQEPHLLPEDPQENQEHEFTIIKVSKPPDSDMTSPASETELQQQQQQVPENKETENQSPPNTEHMSPPRISPTPRPRTPPAITPRKSVHVKPTGESPPDVLHESQKSNLPLPESRKVTRNPSYERALDDDDLDDVVMQAKSGDPVSGTDKNREPGILSDSDSGEIPEAKTDTDVNTMTKSITVEVIPKLAEDVDVDIPVKVPGEKDVAHSQSAHDLAASAVPSPKAHPIRKAPPPPKPKPKLEDSLDMDVKTRSTERDRPSSFSSTGSDHRYDPEGYLEPRKAKSRSTFYDDEYSYVDIPGEQMKGEKTSDKSLKRRRSGAGHFYDFITTVSRSKSTKGSKKEKAESKSKVVKLERSSSESSKSSKSSLKRQKSGSASGTPDRQSSVFYYEINDIVPGDDDKLRRHSSHIYQNHSDGEAMSKTRQEAASDVSDAPKPPPRWRRKAMRERQMHAPTKGAEISTDDDDVGEHEYVLPDDPCLESVRPPKPTDCPPALPSRSKSCVADIKKAEQRRPAPPPMRHRSDGLTPASDEEHCGPPPPLPPKSGQRPSIDLDNKNQNKTEDSCMTKKKKVPTATLR